MPKHLLLIAPHNSYRIAAYCEAARELGAQVTIASAGEHSIISAVSNGVHIDFADVDNAIQLLLTAHQQTPFDAVIGSDDHSVELAARVAEVLSLPHNPITAAQISRRKDKARACLQAAGVNVPTYSVLNLKQSITEQIEHYDFPCVLKPLAMSASRGVIRVNNQQECIAAINLISLFLRDVKDPVESSRLLVEQYIDGAEVAYEGMLSHGALSQLALFDKPEPLVGPYFEESYYISPSRHDMTIQQRVHDTVAASCAAYGLTQGPVHAECRIDALGKVWVMEVAARTIGGECARLVEIATGVKLEKLVIAQALSLSVEQADFSGGAGVLMIPVAEAGILRRVEGTLAAQSVPYIEELVISIREGSKLVPLPEGSSYLGFIYALAPSAEEAELALREAHAALRIVTAPLFEMHHR